VRTRARSAEASLFCGCVKLRMVTSTRATLDVTNWLRGRGRPKAARRAAAARNRVSSEAGALDGAKPNSAVRASSIERPQRRVRLLNVATMFTCLA